MSREKDLAELQQVMDRRIQTWEDWYAFLEQQTKIAGASMHPMLVLSTMYTMFSFMQAMRELPNEGDIKVLVRHAMAILTLQLPQQLGYAQGEDGEPTDTPTPDADHRAKSITDEFLRRLRS